MFKEIELSRIKPNPDNPRRDLGSLDELAKSIKAIGVKQNLTVMPVDSMAYEAGPAEYGGDYIVVIGHRRKEAAKLAGLLKVPCNVAMLSDKERLAAALAENLQRTDLTFAEQGLGFQMMLDLGVDFDAISSQIGIPGRAIKHRMKIVSEIGLDQLLKVQARDVLVTDYEKLLAIHCVKKRGLALEKIGTRDFDWHVESALREQEKEAGRQSFMNRLSAFSKPASGGDLPSDMLLKWTFHKFDEMDVAKLDFIYEGAPEKAEFWHVCKDESVLLFLKEHPGAGLLVNAVIDAVADKLADAEKKDPLPEENGNAAAAVSHTAASGNAGARTGEPVDEKAAMYREIIAREDAKARKDKLTAMFAQARKLRMSFAKQFRETEKTRDRVDAMMLFALLHKFRPEIDILDEVFGDFPWDGIAFEERDAAICGLLRKYERKSSNIRFLSAYCSMEGSGAGGMTALDADGKYSKNPRLIRLYDHLCSLGYVMSVEEEQLINGTHPMYHGAKA